jgi:GDP-4-dehydro-6-deoxy-D-mannose reductase
MATRRITTELDPARLRPSDVPVLVADASRLRLATGWQPEIAFEQSLRDTLNWWRERVGVMPVAP